MMIFRNGERGTFTDLQTLGSFFFFNEDRTEYVAACIFPPDAYVSTVSTVDREVYLHS